MYVCAIHGSKSSPLSQSRKACLRVDQRSLDPQVSSGILLCILLTQTFVTHSSSKYRLHRKIDVRPFFVVQFAVAIFTVPMTSSMIVSDSDFVSILIMILFDQASIGHEATFCRNPGKSRNLADGFVSPSSVDDPLIPLVSLSLPFPDL